MKKWLFAVLLVLPVVGAAGSEQGWLEPFDGSLTEEFYSLTSSGAFFEIQDGQYVGVLGGEEHFDLDNNLLGNADWDVSVDIEVNAPEENFAGVFFELRKDLTGSLQQYRFTAVINTVPGQDSGPSTGNVPTPYLLINLQCGAGAASVQQAESFFGQTYNARGIIEHQASGDVTCRLDDIMDTQVDGVSTIKRVAFLQGTGATGLGSFDNLFINDGVGTHEPLPEDGLGPSEFEDGLIAFAASAGFISQESQLFFALILIGLATVTTSASSKWVAPGRFKNYLLMGVQTLIAIFCVIAAFLDLWMFMVAFMLGLFAVRGGSEVRNSFHEIREALQRQNDRAGDDIGPTLVMEVQVSEREEAVERAFQRLEDQSGGTDTGEGPGGPGEAVSDDEGADS